MRIAALAAVVVAGSGALVPPAGRGAPASAAAALPPAAPLDAEHRAWGALLSRYVRDGWVDYAGWKRDGQGPLGAYLASLRAVPHARYDRWPRAAKLAFGINAYNAAAVRLVLDHYPLRSIRDVGLLPLAAFRTRFIDLPALRPGRMSLDDLENDVLRKELSEPRIHFAIVCASRGCPRLRGEAYRADALEAQLDDAARAFVRDPAKNRFDPRTRTLRLSPIFKWFRGDFERAAGSLEAFVARYAAPQTAAALRAGGVTIELGDYDWSLNGS